LIDQTLQPGEYAPCHVPRLVVICDDRAGVAVGMSA
jgi:hypothetical protein